MERTNVMCSLYEGSGRKRSMGGEEVLEENSSKSARMSAKERTNGFKAWNDVSNISNNRTMTTRSMSMKATEKKDDDLVIVEVINLDEEDFENVNDEIDNRAMEEDEEEEQQQQQQPAVVNDVVEDADVAMLTLDDWPFPWCSEEAFSWFNGYSRGWYSYWEVMSGDHWLPRAESVEAAWRDDQWYL